jgi:hypothetical protein
MNGNASFRRDQRAFPSTPFFKPPRAICLTTINPVWQEAILARIWAAKLRGPVLIHAGQSKFDTTPDALAYIKRNNRVANLPGTFETGGIVGIAEITDCVKRHRSKWFQGPFGWTLANARRLPFKPVKGQLKFFTPTF